MKSGKFLLSLVIITLSFGIYSCSKQTAGCGSGIDCNSVTYSGTIKSLVDTKCNLSGCHAGEFSSYSELKNIADNGKLFQEVVANESMPTGGITMTCEQRAQIECWINAGATNN